MAIHTGSLPRFRQAPLPREAFKRRPSEGFNHLDRLNELTADASTRLRATGIFILGLAAVVAALAII
jgi:hypothetical protein